MNIDEFEFVAFAYVIRKTDDKPIHHESLILLAGNDCDITSKHGRTTIAHGTITIENHEADDMFDTLPIQLHENPKFKSHGIQSIMVDSSLQQQTNFRMEQSAMMHLYVKRRVNNG